MEESSSPVPCRWPEKWYKKEEKTEKSDFFSRQNRQKTGKNPAKTAQNPGKMTEKRLQNTGGGHPLRYRGRAELVTACHRFDPARRGGGASSARRRGIIGPARPVRGDLSSVAGCCCPLLYSYVGRRRAISYRRGIIGPARGGPVLYSYVGRRGAAAGVWRAVLLSGAAVWCWCEVLPVRCCPLLYSYVGRGGGRSPTGAGIIGPARGADRRRGAACPAFSGGGRGHHRRGLSGAICPVGRGAAALSYIVM